MHNDGLWGKVMVIQYLALESMEYCLRREVTSHDGALVIWKASMKGFPLVGKWMAWKVGKGDRVEIDEDPWIGHLGDYRISKSLKCAINHMGIYYLENVLDNGYSSI